MAIKSPRLEPEVSDYGMKSQYYKIVRERRGDLVVGFRVQIMYSPVRVREFPRESNGPFWRNTGRKCFSMKEAQELRDWLIRHDQRDPVTYEDTGE